MDFYLRGLGNSDKLLVVGGPPNMLATDDFQWLLNPEIGQKQPGIFYISKKSHGNIVSIFCIWSCDRNIVSVFSLNKNVLDSIK